MKRILQAMDGVATKPVEGVDSMSKFLRVVSEAEVNQPAPAATPAPAPAAASTLPPDQLAYNQLRAQIDSADALRGGGAYTDVSPEVTASTNAMKQKLAQMAAALKAKGIDAEAAYNAPDPAVAPAAPVDLNQKYASDVTENSLSKFLSIVDNNSSNTLNEGANPHKVALPVQMAMQHYQQPKSIVSKKPSLLSMYLEEAEEAVNQETLAKRAVINQYAQKIANRVLMKESKLDERVLPGEEPASGINRLTGKPNVPAAAAVAPQAVTPEPATSQFSHFSNEYLQKAVDAMNNGVRMRLLISGPDAAAELQRRGVVNEAPIDMTGDPNDPTIYGHEKANPMSLKGRIQQARAQLKELAELANRNDLLAWEEICKKSKGGMFMGLEQNLEQIRHGIEQLAAKRKQGGVASRGIDKNIGENSLGTVLQWPEVVNKVNSAMKATGWKGSRKGDDAYIFSSKGYETDDQYYFVIIDNAGEGFFTYALGTVEEGDPNIDDAYRGKLPNTEASVSELINTIRDGFGLNEGLKNPKDNPCWKGYKPVGTKKKGGRTVPNCVPKE